MVSSSYLREIYERTVGSPKEQVGEINWHSFKDRADGFRSSLNGATLSCVPKKPIINELLKAIEKSSWKVCQKKGLPWIQKWYYPGESKFALFLSHDVDEIRWSWRRKLLMGLKHPSTLTDGRNHYWGFEELMKLERDMGLRSTFFFVSKRRHRLDPPYTIEEVADICKRLRKGGWEVGLHGSYSSFNRREFLEEERRILEEVIGEDIHGVRQHYANFDPAVTFNFQETAGFSYDSTICFKETSGFATGMCQPYRFEGLSLFELPLTVMDGQIFWYEKMDSDGAVQEVLRLTEIVKRYNGLLALDWHQRSFDRHSFPGWAEAYTKILKRLSSYQVFAATGKDILDWWRRRELVRFQDREVRKDSVVWPLSVGRDIEGLTLRICVPKESKYRELDIKSKAKFAVEEESNEIWIRFSAIHEGERIRVSMTK